MFDEEPILDVLPLGDLVLVTGTIVERRSEMKAFCDMKVPCQVCWKERRINTVVHHDDIHALPTLDCTDEMSKSHVELQDWTERGTPRFLALRIFLGEAEDEPGAQRASPERPTRSMRT